MSLERRRGDYDKCVQLFDQYIANTKNKAVASAFSIKYARFLFHVMKDPVAARQALDDAIAKDPLNQRLHLQRLDLAIHVPDTPFSVLEGEGRLCFYSCRLSGLLVSNKCPQHRQAN